MDRHHSGLRSIRGTGSGVLKTPVLSKDQPGGSQSLLKKRRIKGLNLKWDWSSVRQNPRITIKETGIGFYCFYQLKLKKQNGKTRPSTSEGQTS